MCVTVIICKERFLKMRRLLSVVLSIALFLCLVPLAGLSALAAEPLVLSNNFDTEKTITYYLTPQTEGGSFSCRTAPENRDGNYGVSILGDTTESSPNGGDKGVMQFAVNNNKNGCPEHCKHVLETQQKHFRPPKRAGVINPQRFSSVCHIV